MEQNLNIEKLNDWQEVSCNSCSRHNFKSSSINKEKYINQNMYELKARSQTTVLCRDCLHLLEDIIEELNR